MANPIAILSFAWTYVIPVLKDGFVLIKSGVYEHIKDRVDDEDIRSVKGITKRNKVFASAEGYLEEDGIDPDLFSSVLIYLLIEIAVANLKKKQKKLLK
jgi:hypothetical protein